MKPWQRAILTAAGVVSAAGCAREQYVVTDKADNKMVVRDVRCPDSLRVMMFRPDGVLDMKYYAVIQPGDTLALGSLFTLENRLVIYPCGDDDTIIARINGIKVGTLMRELEKLDRRRQEYNQRDSLIRAVRQKQK